MIYRFLTKVIAVDEVKERLNYHKNEEGDYVYDDVSTGWWSIRIVGSSSIRVSVRPDLAAGDEVEITLRRLT